MKKLSCLYFLCAYLWVQSAKAQDPEFPKEFIMHLTITGGTITNFHSTPDLYTGSLQLVPQLTVVPHLLRAGIIAGGLYTGKKLQGEAGVRVSLKLLTLPGGNFGSLGNIHVSLDHLWATERERLLGGGIQVDLLNRIVLGLMAHRDYKLNTWWLQSSTGVRISSKKKIVEPFNP